MEERKSDLTGYVSKRHIVHKDIFTFLPGYALQKYKFVFF